MQRLNKHIIDEVYSAVDESELGPSTYEVTFPAKGECVVSIVFKPDTKFFFKINEVGGGREDRFSTYEKPGEINNEEVYAGLSFYTALERFIDWEIHITLELKAKGESKLQDDIYEQIEKFVEEKVSNPDAFFESSEIDAIQEKLDELSRKFDELKKKSEITENELEKLKSQLSKASSELERYTKSVWYKVSLNRVLNTFKKIVVSKEGREILSSAIKKLIGLE